MCGDWTASTRHYSIYFTGMLDNQSCNINYNFNTLTYYNILGFFIFIPEDY